MTIMKLHICQNLLQKYFPAKKTTAHIAILLLMKELVACRQPIPFLRQAVQLQKNRALQECSVGTADSSLDMHPFCISNVYPSHVNPDMSFASAWDEEHESAEMKSDLIKVEAYPEAEDQQGDGSAEKDAIPTFEARKPDCQVSKVILMRQTSHDLAIISELFSLCEDFITMANSGKSIVCCQPAAHGMILTCQLCGDNFVGRADRMLKLCKHFESEHPTDALRLILDTMKTHSRLIGYMRKALKFDKWFNNFNYAS